MMKIIVQYDPKPIPIRCFDYLAHVDGMEEETGLYGNGATEAEALEDIQCRIEEYEGRV